LDAHSLLPDSPYRVMATLVTVATNATPDRVP
jgi:hypothetical protein